MNNIEVYKQSKRFATEFEVRKELGLMHGRDGVHRLQFNDYQVFYQQVHSPSKVQLHPAIHDGKRDLP
jgi:hypothetical protein